MASKTIIIAELKSNDKFVNIKDNNGTWYGIGKEKSPKLYAEALTKTAGQEITGNHWESKPDETGATKQYLFEPQANSGGGKSFTPKDQGREDGRAAALAVGHLMFGKANPADLGATTAAFDTLFEHICNKIASKSTKVAS